MDRFTIERFVADPVEPALAVPRFRGRHDLGPGLKRWIANETRAPGMLLLQRLETGEMQVRWRSRLLVATAPCVIVLAFGEDVQYGTPDRLGPGYRSTWINFDGVALRAVADRLRGDEGPVWPDADGVIAARLRPLLAPAALVLAPLALARLTADLLLVLHERRSAPAREGVAGRALAALAADPFRPWNLAELAARYGCSRAQLFRSARRRWGVGLKRWLDQQRLQRAELLISQGGRRTADVARIVGYRSVQVLNRRLRAWRGDRPVGFNPSR